MKIFKIGLILIAIFVFGNSVFALTANITQINFTTTQSQSINVNTNSAILIVQTQNLELLDITALFL